VGRFRSRKDPYVQGFCLKERHFPGKMIGGSQGQQSSFSRDERWLEWVCRDEVDSEQSCAFVGAREKSHEVWRGQGSQQPLAWAMKEPGHERAEPE